MLTNAYSRTKCGEIGRTLQSVERLSSPLSRTSRRLRPCTEPAFCRLPFSTVAGVASLPMPLRPPWAWVRSLPWRRRRNPIPEHLTRLWHFPRARAIAARKSGERWISVLTGSGPVATTTAPDSVTRSAAICARTLGTQFAMCTTRTGAKTHQASAAGIDSKSGGASDRSGAVTIAE